jgi:MFS family permease
LFVFGLLCELYACSCVGSVVPTLRSSDLGVFFTEIADDDRAMGAALTFAVIGIGAIGCYLGGRSGDGWGRTRTTAVAMAVSGLCALVIGFVSSLPLALVIGLVWGLAVVADSAQFSTMVTELADQAYVGTALTLQLAIGFTLTVVTIWLIPVIERGQGWGWAFALLVPGPVLGIVAMLRLKSLPEASRLAGGRG